VLEYLERHSVSVRTVPALADIVSGRSEVNDIQEVQIEDILGREPVSPDPKLLFGCVKDKTVMVTGAGGSIGSELSRQILELRPKCLVLFDVSEYALYQIDRELRRLDEMFEGCGQSGNVVIVPALGTVTDQTRLEELMRTFKVDTVYHAAAYKHVPMVEFNPVEGTKNNVFGTMAAAQAARNAGVENFVLISTDKAVRPTSVMGATKRVSELILQAMHIESNGTPIYSMVRFGNVLASSGSVVPLFREQIAQGGPVTVTHPEMTRYFMTIPEAAQLVIQAGSLAVGGDVFVLDMGKPVRIMDLATQMISLSGLRVWDQERGQGDIKIAITGQRPGEKLHEELLLGNNIIQTCHPRIMRANEEFLSPQRIGVIIEQLRSACSLYDSDLVIQILGNAITEFVPHASLADKALLAAMHNNIKKRFANIVAAP
jgi:FlaA1/EpsC-like NDP-sugar epimerase